MKFYPQSLYTGSRRGSLLPQPHPSPLLHHHGHKDHTVGSYFTEYQDPCARASGPSAAMGASLRLSAPTFL